MPLTGSCDPQKVRQDWQCYADIATRQSCGRSFKTVLSGPHRRATPGREAQLARALIIVDELAIEGDLDARAIGLNDEAVPRTDRDLRRGRRRLQNVDRTGHLERILADPSQPAPMCCNLYRNASGPAVLWTR